MSQKTTALQYYAEENNASFGGYNLLFNNCSDYTDMLLDFADVDGLFTQAWLARDNFISIPVNRQIQAIIAGQLDTGIRWIGEKIKTTGDNVRDKRFLGSAIIGWQLNLIGDDIINTADKIGDAYGAIVGAKDRASRIINEMIKFGKRKIRNWINSW